MTHPPVRLGDRGVACPADGNGQVAHTNVTQIAPRAAGYHAPPKPFAPAKHLRKAAHVAMRGGSR